MKNQKNPHIYFQDKIQLMTSLDYCPFIQKKSSVLTFSVLTTFEPQTGCCLYKGTPNSKKKKEKESCRWCAAASVLCKKKMRGVAEQLLLPQRSQHRNLLPQCSNIQVFNARVMLRESRRTISQFTAANVAQTKLCHRNKKMLQKFFCRGCSIKKQLFR